MLEAPGRIRHRRQSLIVQEKRGFWIIGVNQFIFFIGKSGKNRLLAVAGYQNIKRIGKNLKSAGGSSDIIIFLFFAAAGICGVVAAMPK